MLDKNEVLFRGQRKVPKTPKKPRKTGFWGVPGAENPENRENPGKRPKRALFGGFRNLNRRFIGKLAPVGDRHAYFFPQSRTVRGGGPKSPRAYTLLRVAPGPTVFPPRGGPPPQDP